MVRSIKYRPLDPSHPNENIKLDGLVQDCSNSIANALELLQCCTKPSVTDDLGFWTTEYMPLLVSNVTTCFHYIRW